MPLHTDCVLHEIPNKHAHLDKTGLLRDRHLIVLNASNVLDHLPDRLHVWG
jgi:hypothetical protein